MTEELLTVKELAEFLKCGATRAYAIAGELGFLMGGRRLVRMSRVMAYIKEKERECRDEQKKASTSAGATGGAGLIPSRKRRQARGAQRSRAHMSGSQNESGSRQIRITQPRTKPLSETGQSEC